MRWTQITECGPVRRRNEDWLSVCPNLGLFAVADGMGGHQAGDVASRLALEVLEHCLGKLQYKKMPSRDRLAWGIQQANEAVYLAAREDMQRRGMGTTITACLVEDYKVTVANVGDSRALLLREGQINKLTVDHSLVQELIDGGGISEKEALRHPQRNVLTRALGIDPRVDVDIYEYGIAKGDRLLICTDGLTGFVPEQRIGELVMLSPNLHETVYLLQKEAIAFGSNDNITIILLAVD
ncbi:Stp1/IreP family PP2C-type Ser/Thr phosphatase [Desulfoscipio gibsoniae]|uniref:Serine/threonine protein phosphatase n=1 Tax=Desulfoscipio gibsoniae DSM 7213 TaxID=767817 RepID=R4KKY5_9FIRM|nr:Stp1/IreP family PP2C-type Ser/Thr phosphatase [Desulfoscipio gibsoniae]AGL02237.1 serine/threonine protein phosphatase [Desulfoscipio gibsoniae DSM 7213]